MRTPKAPKVRLHITQEQINTATQRDSTHCMIADAVKVARPDATSVSVDLATIRFTDPERGLRFTYLTPRIAQICLVDFDRGRKPEPFSFLLRGAQVTRSGNTKSLKTMSDRERQQRSSAAKKMNDKLKKARLVQRDKTQGTVSDRVGGKTPPLQSGHDGVPFTRRRAFGLRAMEY